MQGVPIEWLIDFDVRKGVGRKSRRKIAGPNGSESVRRQPLLIDAMNKDQPH
jgi:hypothetical protein